MIAPQGPGGNNRYARSAFDVISICRPARTSSSDLGPRIIISLDGLRTAPARGLKRSGRHFTADARGVAIRRQLQVFPKAKVPPYSYGKNVPHAVQTLVSIRDLIFSIQHGGNTHFSRGEILISARWKYSLTARPVCRAFRCVAGSPSEADLSVCVSNWNVNLACSAGPSSGCAVRPKPEVRAPLN